MSKRDMLRHRPEWIAEMVAAYEKDRIDRGPVSHAKMADAAEALIARLSDPDDRMVEAAAAAFDWKQAEECGLHDVMKAAIRAAMKAAGE